MLRAVQMGDVPPLATVRREVPPALAAAVETALEPDVANRWDTAAELAQALLAWLAAAGATPSKTRLAETMARLFGGDAAARRLAAVTSPADATVANQLLPPPDAPTELSAGPRLSPLRPERWIRRSRCTCTCRRRACRRSGSSGRCSPSSCRRAGSSSASTRSTAERWRRAWCRWPRRRRRPAVDAALPPLAPPPHKLTLVPRSLHLAADPAGLALPSAPPVQRRAGKAHRHDHERRMQPDAL